MGTSARSAARAVDLRPGDVIRGLRGEDGLSGEYLVTRVAVSTTREVMLELWQRGADTHRLLFVPEDVEVQQPGAAA